MTVSPPQFGMNRKGRTHSQRTCQSPQPFELDTRDELSVIRQITRPRINSVLLAKTNYGAKFVRLIRLLARLEDVLTDGKFVLDG